MPADNVITLRKGSAALWSGTNPVLASGEPGYDITNNILKVGDGIRNYTNLPILFSGTYQPSGNYSNVGHTHTSNQISDFNSSVSGLLPVKNIISGSGISISSSSGNFTINSTSTGSSSTELVYDYATISGLPASGDNTKLYCTTDTNRIYRWTGSVYVELGSVGGGDASLWNLFLPPAPTGLTTSAGNTQVSLSWSAPTVSAQTPITDYIIQYSSNSGSTWTTFSDGTSSSTSATVTGLTNGTAYTFRVVAVNAVGQGAYSTASASVTPLSSFSVTALVIAGGGGGGRDNGGGGGAGGYVEQSLTVTSGTQYTVSVGAGGAAATPGTTSHGGNGSNSVFSSITAVAGGGAGGQAASGANGNTGGSGGGGANGGTGAAGTAGQGNAGGNGTNEGNFYPGGGGGGSGSAGATGSSNAGAGGNGTASSITGSSVTRAGGGGGASFSTGGSAGTGGAGAGVSGNNSTTAASGTANSGSGGGGACSGTSGAGGSGVVIIRAPQAAASTTGSPTVTTVGGDTVYTFTGTGSITF